jgi:hypothetical protein
MTFTQNVANITCFHLLVHAIVIEYLTLLGELPDGAGIPPLRCKCVGGGQAGNRRNTVANRLSLNGVQKHYLTALQVFE